MSRTYLGHFHRTSTGRKLFGRPLRTNQHSLVILPEAVVAATPESGDAPLTVQFDDSTGSTAPGAARGVATVGYVFGDGEADGVASDPEHDYTDADTYTAVVTLTDELGYAASDSVEITADTP